MVIIGPKSGCSIGFSLLFFGGGAKIRPIGKIRWQMNRFRDVSKFINSREKREAKIFFEEKGDVDFFQKNEGAKIYFLRQNTEI